MITVLELPQILAASQGLRHKHHRQIGVPGRTGYPDQLQLSPLAGPGLRQVALSRDDILLRLSHLRALLQRHPNHFIQPQNRDFLSDCRSSHPKAQNNNGKQLADPLSLPA